MASRNEIPESGPGLLGGFMMGAIGGAEQYIQEENTSRRAFALEDYRAQRERELADYKAELAKAEREEGYAREDVANKQAKVQWQKTYTAGRQDARREAEDKDADRAIDQTRAEAELARAEAAAKSDDIYSKQPDAGEKANYLLNVIPDIESAYPELFGDDAGFNPALSLGDNPKADKRTAEDIIRKLSSKKDDPRAQTIVQAMRRYLQNNAVWTNADFMEWTTETREVIGAMGTETQAPTGQPRSFTVIGKKQG